MTEENQGERKRNDPDKYANEYNKPLKFMPDSSDPIKLMKLINGVLSLSSNEKDILVQALFGRPVMILKVQDSCGEFWYELLQAYLPNSEAELGFIVNKQGGLKHIG